MTFEMEQRTGEDDRRVQGRNGESRGLMLSWRSVVDGLMHVLVLALTVIGWMVLDKVKTVDAAVARIHVELQAADTRLTAIENSRFSAVDGLNIWRAVDDKPDRKELTDALTRIEDLLLQHIVEHRTD